MTATWMQGDVHEQLAKIPDSSIDLVVTSPPFLALRSYLPADHPDKDREIGSEATPADFLDTLLELTAEWGRVLAPHGSICVELGDTYSASGGGGGDYAEGGMREGQGEVDGSARRSRVNNLYNTSTRYSDEWNKGNTAGKPIEGVPYNGGPGWPLAKSLTGIPTLYAWSLAYGRNLLTGEPSPAGQWRIRNIIVWARPNPPVGALGDKFRPATSYITVACRSAKRYFDLDAVRVAYSPDSHPRTARGLDGQERTAKTSPDGNRATLADVNNNGAGAPPLDWHTDGHPEDGDWLWKLSTAPYKGAHYAAYPLALPTRLIEAMCPQRVCTVCGKPAERIVGEVEYVQTRNGGTPATLDKREGQRPAAGVNNWSAEGAARGDNGVTRQTVTLGWTDCGCEPICGNGCTYDIGNMAQHLPSCDVLTPRWRRGHVLDPFAGSGTTGAAAVGVGRDATLIDIDARNLELARERIGMFLEEATA